MDVEKEVEVDPERVAAVKTMARLAIRKLATTTAGDLGCRVKTMEWTGEVLKREAHNLSVEVNAEVARLQMLALASLAEESK